MRVLKVEGLTLTWVPPGEEEASGHYDENQDQDLPTARYFYDGQMCVEDDFTDVVDESIVVTEMRYGIGARGIDFLGRRYDGGAETKAFPLYDGHGNMIATLARSESSPYFGIADQRSYDVWGSLRYSQSSGDPRQRYCANLGHVQDDESGLIYMRARYYEPWTGRFVSKDRMHDGDNWYVYAYNDPLNLVDADGQLVSPAFATVFLAMLQALGTAAGHLVGFFLTVEALQAMHPAFKPTPEWLGTFLPVALSGLAALITAKLNIGGGVTWATLLGPKYAGRSLGIGFAMGLVTGAHAAKIAFEIYYGDHFEDFSEF